VAPEAKNKRQSLQGVGQCPAVNEEGWRSAALCIDWVQHCPRGSANREAGQSRKLERKRVTLEDRESEEDGR
jgi:hypothetical protein